MNTMTLKYWVAIVAGITAMCAQAAGENIAVNDAWIREAPPGATVMSGYAQIANGTKSTMTVTAIRSEAFDKIEIHKSEIKDGVARMQPLGKLDIKSRQAVTLAPNGTHLMLIRPKKPLRAGDRVMLQFTLGSGTTINATAEVRKDSQEDTSLEHGHH